MKEGDELVGGPFERFFVDEADSRIGSLAQLPLDVIGRKGYVMDSFSIFLEEFGDRTLRIRRFQKLDMNITCFKKGGLYALRLYFLRSVAVEPEGLFVVRDRFREAADGDAEMVDFLNHGFNSLKCRF